METKTITQIKIEPKVIPFKCPVCNGFGTLRNGTQKCHACKGLGYIEVKQEDIPNGNSTA